VEALFFFPFVSFRVRVGDFGTLLRQALTGDGGGRLGGGWGREPRRSGTAGGGEMAPLGELPWLRMAARRPLGHGSRARTGSAEGVGVTAGRCRAWWGKNDSRSGVCNQWQLRIILFQLHVYFYFGLFWSRRRGTPKICTRAPKTP